MLTDCHFVHHGFPIHSSTTIQQMNNMKLKKGTFKCAKDSRNNGKTLTCNKYQSKPKHSRFKKYNIRLQVRLVTGMASVCQEHSSLFPSCRSSRILVQTFTEQLADCEAALCALLIACVAAKCGTFAQCVSSFRPLHESETAKSVTSGRDHFRLHPSRLCFTCYTLEFYLFPTFTLKILIHRKKFSRGKQQVERKKSEKRRVKKNGG